MQLGEPDASGRRRPEPIKGSEFTMSFDNIIAAIGQRPEVPEPFGVAVERGNTIQADSDSWTDLENQYKHDDDQLRRALTSRAFLKIIKGPNKV